MRTMRFMMIAAAVTVVASTGAGQAAPAAANAAAPAPRLAEALRGGIKWHTAPPYAYLGFAIEQMPRGIAHHQGQIHLTWNLYKAAHGVK